ncbi:14043_t:CDS:2 [Dentiscutata erythropus]|uniref:14043_t:CDS:1 n=1 Tax=Dentiscutata erythropus TaxID=1348616 RepID=A0A9N9GGW6_9GLOM|nr:14043_t:CDS:2 [Dentiscutata erythropus]
MTKETVKKKVCQFYTIQEKVIVVQYALRESNTKAAAKFGLDKSQVGYWVTKLKDQLNEIVEMRNAVLAITYNSLKLEMLKIVSETASKSYELVKRQLASSFKTSSTWLGKRWPKTNKSSSPPGVIVSFHKKGWIDEQEISPEIIQRAFHKCSISNAMDGSENNEILTYQTSDEIHRDDDEICHDEVSSENIIIIDSSDDKDNNSNQDIFVGEDEEVLIFTTNQ